MRPLSPWRRAAILAVLTSVVAGGSAHAEIVTVGPRDGACAGAIFTRIQSALDVARPGDTIVICPGTYEEQLLVTKRLRIRALPGARLAATDLRPLASSLRTGRPIAAGLTLQASAVVEGLAVDVSGHGLGACDGTEPLLAGVFVRGVPATIIGTSVVGARFAERPAGCENGVGILVQGSGGDQRARLEGNSIAQYQRAGIAIENPGVRARIVQNVVAGDGDTPERMQVGIEVGTGVLARIDDNLVRDHAGASGATCELDAGIVLRAARARLRANQLVGNAIGLLALARGHVIADNTIDGGAQGLFGLVLDGDESRVTANALGPLTAAGIVVGGSRNRLRANSVHDVRAATCEAERADAPGCAALLAHCGVGVWLAGQANQVLGTLQTGTDVAVVDEGRANVVR